LLIDGLTDVAELAIGEAHTCARLLDGDVSCWGRNSLDELGRPEPHESATPLRVPDVHDALEIAIAGALTCARLRDGGVICWGASKTHDPLGSDARRPRRVEGLAGAQSIAVAANSACARTSADAWHCWSWTEWDSHRRVRMNPARPEPSMTGVVSTTHGDCDCHLRTNGVVDCSSAASQCPADGLTDVRTLYDRCAIMNDGTVRCWNEMFLARDGGTPGMADLHEPTAIDGITDATTLAFGLHHYCALTSAGAVLCWGANSASQIEGGASMSGVWPPLRVDGR
jgi:hypothetical protein